MKESGLGRRHGADGMLKYTEPQTVAIQRLVPTQLLPKGILSRDVATPWLTTKAWRLMQ